MSKIAIQVWHYHEEGVVDPSRYMGDPRIPVDGVKWVELPADILRLILWKYCDVFDRTVSCWRVCRRWNYELAAPLQDRPLYSSETRRTLDLYVLARYHDHEWETKYGDDARWVFNHGLKSTFYSHVGRIMVNLHRRRYMDKLRKQYEASIEVEHRRAMDAEERGAALEQKLRHLERHVDPANETANTLDRIRGWRNYPTGFSC